MGDALIKSGIVTAVQVCLLSMVRLKDAFAISLSFLFSFLGVVEFILGCCSPNTFTDNGCLVAAMALLAFEISICNYSGTPAIGNNL